MTFESSPYYMFHPLAAGRIARDLPGVKLLVLVRDPVERAYSAHAHELARGFETEPFERALELEDERLGGEAERITADPAYLSHSQQHHAYVARGQYADQLERAGGAVRRGPHPRRGQRRLLRTPEPVVRPGAANSSACRTSATRRSSATTGARACRYAPELQLRARRATSCRTTAAGALAGRAAQLAPGRRWPRAERCGRWNHQKRAGRAGRGFRPAICGLMP